MRSLEIAKAAGCSAALAVAAGLSACSTPLSLQPGATRADVLQRLGPPTGDYALPDGGHRVEYARGPMGKQTYMLDFDASDRLRGSSQVLEEKRFNAIQAGMSAAEVLRQIGRPSTTWAIPRQQQIVWSYRYDTPFCQWFMVGMGTNNDHHVIDTAYGPDPACEINEFSLLGFGRGGKR